MKTNIKKNINKNRLVKTTTFLMTALIVLIMISSSLSASVVREINQTVTNEKTYIEDISEPDTTGTGGRGTPIFTEGFEGYVPPGPPSWPPTGWVIHDVGTTGRTWELYESAAYAYSGTYMARCPYDYSADAPNDDWLVTASSVVQTAGAFSFYAAQYTSGGPEPFQVYYSKTGNTVDDFLVTGTLLADTSVSSMVPSYTFFSYDMSAEEGETVWFAIRYIGDYEWYIYVEDVTLPDGTFVDFDSGTPGSGWPPAGWSTIQTNTDTSNTIPGYWSATDYDKHSGTYSAGFWWSLEHQDEWLITPGITLTGSAYDIYYLNFWTYGWEGSIYDDHYYVKVSTDGGSNWDILLDLSDLTLGDWNAWDYPYEIDLSAYADETINIAWHAIDCNDPGNPNYPGMWYIWLIDDIEVGYVDLAAHDTGVTSIISPTGTMSAEGIIPMVNVQNFGANDEIDVPVHMEITRLGSGTAILDEGFEGYNPGVPGGVPTSWTVLTNETYDYGDWVAYNYASHVYSGDYSVKGDPGSTTIDPHSDAWLISEQLSLSGSPGSLTFWYQSESDSHWVSFEVLVSTDSDPTYYGGYTVEADITATTTVWNQASIDMSAYAGLDVYIALRMYDSDTSYWYVFVDEFVLDGWTEGFEGTSGSGFPPAGWTHEIVTGTDTDNEWDISDGTSSHPSGVIPHGGTYMTQYDSYFIYGGESARLYSYAMDFLAEGGTTYTLRFWMNHDTGYTSNDDRVEIQGSTDGSTWTTLDTLSRYDGTTGWTEHTVDLSAYASDTTVYVGFLGISEYGNSIYIDDVIVEMPASPILEYDETVYINLLSGEVKTVTFPGWIPDDLKTTELDYEVTACTELLTDEDPSNDCDAAALTLLFEEATAECIISPDPIHAAYARTIIPMNATIVLGNFVGFTASDIDCDSILINGFIEPNQCEVLPGSLEFDEEVLVIQFYIAPFIEFYMPLWDTHIYEYTVTFDVTTLRLDPGHIAIGEVTMTGHRSGDLNSDLHVDIDDVVYLISYIFNGGQEPAALCSADTNGNGEVDIDDAVYLISYIFSGGPQPCKDACEPAW